MRTKNVLRIFSISFLVFILFLGFMLREKSQISPVIKVEQRGAEKAANTDKEEIQAAAISTVKISQPTKIVQEFAQARDMRAFSELAKSRPKEGGYFYAQQSNAYCEGVRRALDSKRGKSRTQYDPKEDSQTYSKRMDAWKILNQRCQSFLSSELGFNGLLASDHNKRAHELHDPLTLEDEDMFKAIAEGGKAELYDAAQKLLKLKDPYLLGYHLPSLMTYPREEGIALRLDGKGYPANGPEYLPLLRATELVGCDFGKICDNSNQLVATECFLNGNCYDDLFEFMRNVRWKDNEKQYQLTLQFYKRLVEVVQQEQVDAFRSRGK